MPYTCSGNHAACAASERSCRCQEGRSSLWRWKGAECARQSSESLRERDGDGKVESWSQDAAAGGAGRRLLSAGGVAGAKEGESDNQLQRSAEFKVPIGSNETAELLGPRSCQARRWVEGKGARIHARSSLPMRESRAASSSQRQQLLPHRAAASPSQGSSLSLAGQLLPKEEAGRAPRGE